MMKKTLAAIMGVITTLAMSGITLSNDITVTTDVTGYLEATFQYSAVAYGTLAAGSANIAGPSQASGDYNVTVNTTNNYKVSASGTDFDAGGGHTFYVGNLSMHAATAPGSLSLGSATALTGVSQQIATGFTPSDTNNYNGYWLSIPSTQWAASYSSTVTVTYANV